jgi:hypothetical protein
MFIFGISFKAEKIGIFERITINNQIFKNLSPECSKIFTQIRTKFRSEIHKRGKVQILSCVGLFLQFIAYFVINGQIFVVLIS